MKLKLGTSGLEIRLFSQGSEGATTLGGLSFQAFEMQGVNQVGQNLPLVLICVDQIHINRF